MKPTEPNPRVAASDNSDLRAPHLRAIAEAVRNGGQASVVANALVQLNLESVMRLQKAHDVVARDAHQKQLGDRRNDDCRRAAKFALKLESQAHQMLGTILEELSDLLDVPARVYAEEQRRLDSDRREKDDDDAGYPVSAEDIRRVAETMTNTDLEIYSPGKNEILESSGVGITDESTENENQGAGANDLQLGEGPLDRLKRAVSSDVSAKSTIEELTLYILVMAQRTLDQYPLIDQMAEFAARSDPRWKRSWLCLHRGLKQEQEMQRSFLKSAESLLRDLALKKRAHMEAIACTALSGKELRRMIYVSFCELAIVQGLTYRMPIEPATKAAEELGIDLGLPREDDFKGFM